MFPSAVIERRLKYELGLCGNAALAWFEMLPIGKDSTITDFAAVNIDQRLPLDKVVAGLNAMVQTSIGPTSPPITKASMWSMIPTRMKQEETHGPYFINAEMFAEMHRFLRCGLLDYLAHNSDAMKAWSNGALHLGDETCQSEQHGVALGDQEQALKETKSSAHTAAGSTFRLRCYNSFYNDQQLIVVFTLARRKSYIFKTRWGRGPTEYVWMNGPKQVQLRASSINQIVDLFWPYLCYVERNQTRSLAPKYFATPRWVSSWNRRYCKRLRGCCTTMLTKKSAQFNKSLVSMFASGVGPDLSGNGVVLPNSIMLRVWSYCGWHENKPPTMYDRSGRRLRYPPAPTKEDLAVALQQM